MIYRKGENNCTVTITRVLERLNEQLPWYPFPAIIGFILVLILGGHLLTGLNPRLGARVDVIPFTSERFRDGGIWLGVYVQDKSLAVVTSDRRKFTFPLETGNLEDIKPLINYLNDRVKKEAFSTALKMESSLIQTTAIIAADQRLNYAHLRPIIYALAKAKISRYGFETRIIRN